MARKKEQILGIQSERIEQLTRESGGHQTLFDKGGLFEKLKKRLSKRRL